MVLLERNKPVRDLAKEFYSMYCHVQWWVSVLPGALPSFPVGELHG
jgi:hypothetical protein